MVKYRLSSEYYEAPRKAFDSIDEARLTAVRFLRKYDAPVVLIVRQTARGKDYEPYASVEEDRATYSAYGKKAFTYFEYGRGIMRRVDPRTGALLDY